MQVRIDIEAADVEDQITYLYKYKSPQQRQGSMLTVSVAFDRVEAPLVTAPGMATSLEPFPHSLMMAV